MINYAALAQYRHTVAEMYAAVRADNDPEIAAARLRAAKDDLYKNNPLSPIPDRENFMGLPYAPYDPAWRFTLPIDTDVEHDVFEGEISEGVLKYMRYGVVHFTAPTGEAGTLSLFWLMGYGGGLFLPFRDATGGDLTYGGGRYLIDTIKGADLGVDADSIVLDFNFAYHPSCFYSPEWACPLALPENFLSFPIPVGELTRFSESRFPDV